MMFIRNKNREEKTRVPKVIEKITSELPDIVSLVKRASSGDSESFGELYSIYLDPIYRYVFYQIRDKMMAEDITEEVFLKAWKGINSCKGKEHTFSSWLYRVAHNHIIDYFRSRQKYLKNNVSIVDTGDIADFDSPELTMETRQDYKSLLDDISHLSRDQKQVIILKFIEDLDNREIGQIMNKSEGAIRILQMRALKRLRQKHPGER